MATNAPEAAAEELPHRERGHEQQLQQAGFLLAPETADRAKRDAQAERDGEQGLPETETGLCRSE